MIEKGIGVLLMVALGAIGLQESSKATDEERTRDTYAVYAAVLAGQRGGTNVAVSAIAASTFQTGRTSCVTAPASYATDWDEVLADVKARRNISRVLDSALKLTRPYLLLNDAEVKAFIAAQGLASLQNPPPANPQFQGARTLFQLSDVYFNKKRTLGFTVVSETCGSECGSLTWNVFEKSSSGQWEVRPWSHCIEVALLDYGGRI